MHWQRSNGPGLLVKDASQVLFLRSRQLDTGAEQPQTWNETFSHPCSSPEPIICMRGKHYGGAQHVCVFGEGGLGGGGGSVVTHSAPRCDASDNFNFMPLLWL